MRDVQPDVRQRSARAGSVRSQRAAWAAFVVAVLVQLAVLYAPEVPGPAGGVPYADLLVHAAVFAAVGWTGRRAGVPVLLLAVALAGHAVLSEVLQATALAERSGEPADVVADLVGTAAGLLLPIGRGGRR